MCVPISEAQTSSLSISSRLLCLRWQKSNYIIEFLSNNLTTDINKLRHYWNIDGGIHVDKGNMKNAFVIFITSESLWFHWCAGTLFPSERTHSQFLWMYARKGTSQTFWMLCKLFFIITCRAVQSKQTFISLKIALHQHHSQYFVRLARLIRLYYISLLPDASFFHLIASLAFGRHSNYG